MDLPDSVIRTSAYLHGKKFSYLLASPTSPAQRATIFLIHGLTDWSLGWQFQMLPLANLGYLVVAPDMAGCGLSSAPTNPEEYSITSLAYNVKTLAEYILGPSRSDDDKIILGGHDAGCSVVWETCLRYPNLVKAAFSIISPLTDRSGDQNDAGASSRLQHWEYQLQLNYTEIEENTQDAKQLSQFVHALYGATTPDGKYAVSVEQGIRLDVLSDLRKSPILPEAEADYFTQILLLRQYSEKVSPLRGMLNWHRAGKVSRDGGWGTRKSVTKLQIPALLITARMDGTVRGALEKEMRQRFSHVKIRQVGCHDFILRQAPVEVNSYVSNWLRALNDI